VAGSACAACAILATSPTCPQIKRARIGAQLCHAQGIETSWAGCRVRATNRLAAFVKAMSWQLTIASNGLWSVRDSPSPPTGKRSSRAIDSFAPDRDAPPLCWRHQKRKRALARPVPLST
jgi:hypothetical protein